MDRVRHFEYLHLSTIDTSEIKEGLGKFKAFIES